MTTIVKRTLEKQTQATPTKMVVSPNSELRRRNNLVTAKPKSQNVLWSRLPIVSWRKSAKEEGVQVLKLPSPHLLPRLKELSEKSVTHRTKAKLEGANEEDKGDHDEDVVGEQLIEVGIAKDQAFRVGGDPEYSGKYDCPDSHARGTKHQKDFPEKRDIANIKIQNSDRSSLFRI